MKMDEHGESGLNLGRGSEGMSGGVMESSSCAIKVQIRRLNGPRAVDLTETVEERKGPENVVLHRIVKLVAV